MIIESKQPPYMLSAFSRIQLTSGPITVNPLVIPELKVVELSDEDFMKHFYSFEGDGEEASENENNKVVGQLMKNDYYCKAVLKLPTSITATFESNPNYVNYRYYLLNP